MTRLSWAARMTSVVSVVTSLIFVTRSIWANKRSTRGTVKLAVGWVDGAVSATAPSELPSYRGYRYPAEIISYAVWLYYRFSLSVRDVEELLAERTTLHGARRDAGAVWSTGPAPRFLIRSASVSTRAVCTW